MAKKAKCTHCSMIQPDWWIEQENELCKYCTYDELVFYESKPIKINCKYCQTMGGHIRKDIPIRDYVILG